MGTGSAFLIKEYGKSLKNTSKWAPEASQMSSRRAPGAETRKNTVFDVDLCLFWAPFGGSFELHFRYFILCISRNLFSAPGIDFSGFWIPFSLLFRPRRDARMQQAIFWKPPKTIRKSSVPAGIQNYICSQLFSIPVFGRVFIAFSVISVPFGAPFGPLERAKRYTKKRAKK